MFELPPLSKYPCIGGCGKLVMGLSCDDPDHKNLAAVEINSANAGIPPLYPMEEAMSHTAIPDLPIDAFNGC